MSELSAKQRNSLNNTTFGIPSLRKYPLNDKEHVLKAIQMFHHCPLEYKRELAHNINKQANKYDITISKDSNIYNYLNEEEQIEIDMFEDIALMETSLYINEAFGMNEEQARLAVDNAISCWKKRKNAVGNIKDKNKLVTDVKNEKTAIEGMQSRNDLNGIINRAKMTANRMSKNIDSNPNKARGLGDNRLRGVNDLRKMKRVRRMAGGLVVGAVIGNSLGNKSAQKHDNGRTITKAKKIGGTAAGAATGLAVGTAIATTGVIAQDVKAQEVKRKMNDPDRPFRQHAERYANFINNFIGEVNEINTTQLAAGSQQQNEGRF